MRTRTVENEGAHLHCEIWAENGPLLVMIPGGPLDAEVYSPLAQALSDRFKPLAYDPRGNSRSLSEDSELPTLETHADDVACIIENESGAPAIVFGSSMGGLIALELVNRRPDLLHQVIVHEPPCISIMPDAQVLKAQTVAIYNEYREKGLMAAMSSFARMTGMNGPPPQHMRDPAVGARLIQNMDRFFATSLPLSEHRFDLDSIRSSDLITVTVGSESGDIPAARCAHALGMALSRKVVLMPGGHMGYAEDPSPFAVALRNLIV